MLLAMLQSTTPAPPVLQQPAPSAGAQLLAMVQPQAHAMPPPQPSALPLPSGLLKSERPQRKEVAVAQREAADLLALLKPPSRAT